MLSGRELTEDCKDLTTIITAGGSEANCLAIKAVTKFYKCKTKDAGDQCKLHIITSDYEHKSILKCLDQM